MFEKLLEGVLLSYFGRYLTGFDKNNLKLGVWSGNVVIENVQVKPDIIESLELPVDLVHSTIGRLVMKVPWNKLSSSPVEVLIEDILIVIAPKDHKDWDFSDKRLVQKRLNVLSNYARIQFEKFLTKKGQKKTNQPDDQQGYFDKLTLKVIENLQLSIKNIHVRWESKNPQQSYAWGIKLNSLDVFTTNIQWQKQFIDRTDEKNRLTPQNKQVLLNKLIIYWNSDEKTFFDIDQMEEFNSIQCEEVINITAEFKWSQNVRSLFDQPLFDVLFDLNWIDITLKYSQLQQLILMLENISLYTKILWMERKGTAQIKYDQEEFKISFVSLFTKIQKSEQKSIEVLDEDEQNQLSDIIKQVEYETLFLWTQSVMKVIILESKVQELQKQRTQRGWFGWGGKNNDGDQVVLDAEIKEMEQYIEKTLEEQTDDLAIKRPLSSIKYKGTVLLRGGSIEVSKSYINGTMERDGIKMNCKEVKFDVEQTQNKDFSSLFSIVTLGLYIQQKMFNCAQSLIPLCFQQQKTEEESKFFKFSLQKVNKDIQDVSSPDLIVSCNVEPLTMVYHPGIIQFLREMKDVKKGSLEESLKSATWNRLEKIQDTTKSRVNFLLASALQLELNFIMVQLKIIIPMSIPQSEAWSMTVDNIMIKSHQKNVADIYEYFNVIVENSALIYETKNLGGQINQLSVFKKYSVDISLAKLKESVVELVQEQGNALIKIQGRLDPLKLTLNERSYRDLIYIPEAIIPAQSESQRLGQLKKEKQYLVKQCILSGWIKSRGENIRVWNKYFMILSGGYLYLYDNESALMFNTQVYIKNGLITRMDGDEEDQEEFAIQIENRYDSCIIAFEDENNLKQWTDVLNKKIKEYATEEEYIKLQEGQLDDQQKDDSQRANNLLDIGLVVESTELTIYKGSQQENILLYLKSEGIEYNYQKSKKSFALQAKMRNLVLRDWTYQFQNEQFQDLISMRSDDYCLDVQIISLKHQHKKYEKVDLLIKCRVDQIQVNWKPDSFLELRNLMLIVRERKSRKMYYSSVKDYEVESIQKGGSKVIAEDLRVRKLTDAMNDSLFKCGIYHEAEAGTKDYFNYFLDFESFIQNYDWIYKELVQPFYKQQNYKKPSSVLIQLDCTIKSANFNFFQFQSHAMLFKLETSLVEFSFKKLQFNNFLSCSVHDLNAYDMTNYPTSVNSEKEFNKVIPFKLIGRRPGHQGELVRFRFAGLDELLYPNADRCNIFLLIEINEIFAIYQHQPIMRIIDYIIVQIVSLLRQPEYLTMNAAVLEQKRMGQSKIQNIQNLLKAKRVWGDLDEIFKKFICPTFIDCRVVLKNPNLQIKGFQQFDKYFQLDAKEILVFNGQEIDNSRLLKKGGQQLIKGNQGMPDGTIKEAWCETYYVEAQELIIQYVDGEDVKGMSDQLNFNLSFQRVLNSNEVQVVYPDIEYDRSLKIRSAMTPIILKAYKDEYLQICRMIFHNFQYDDIMDRYYIHDFEVVRSFDPSPISFYLDFTEVSIFAMSSLQTQPLAQVNMKNMRLKWIRDPTMNIELDLFGQVFSMYHYLEQDDMTYEERGFVGDLQRSVIHRLQGFKDGLKLDQTFYNNNKQDLQEKFKMYEFDNFNESSVQFTMLFKIIRPIGDKNIFIYLKDLKMIVQLSVFANVGLWSLLDQMCWPPQNDFGEIPGLQLITEIRNVSLCLPTTSGVEAMATKGEISYVFSRSRMPNHQWMINQQKDGKLNPRLIQQIGDAFEHKVTLQSLELFKCNINEFIDLPIQEVHKRNIIMPFSFFLGIKNEIQITPQVQPQPQIYYINKYESSMDKTIVKFSYQDLIVLMDIVDYNSRQQKMILREPQQQQQPQVDNQLTPTPINNVYDAIIHGLQIVIINDAGEAQVPVFDLTLYESQIIFHQTQSKSILSTVISLSSTFFNPLIAVWEPIIERCTFALDMSLNQISNPKKYVILEMNSPNDILNINFSLQMLNVFHKTFLSWDKEMSVSKKLQQTQMNSSQLNQLDSQSRLSVNNKKRNQPISVSSRLEVDESPEEKKEYDQNANKSGITSYSESKTHKWQKNIGRNTLIETIDHVSPYTIKNETGFLIEVEDDSEEGKLNPLKKLDPKQKYVLPSGASINYQIDADIEQGFSKDTFTIKDQRLIKFRVIHPEYEFQQICGIDMDTLRSRKVALKCGNNLFCLYVEVVPKDTRKLLLITSEIMIYNKTDQILDIRLFESEGHIEKNEMMLIVQPSRAISIPFDRTRAFMSFRFKLEKQLCLDQFSPMVKLETIFELKDKTFEFNHTGDQYTMIRCTKRGTNQTIIYLEPPYTIKNCLPMQIDYELFSDEPESRQTYDDSSINANHVVIELPIPLSQSKNPSQGLRVVQKGVQAKQEEIQIHNISQQQRLAIKIRIPSYQQSDIGILYNPFILQQITRKKADTQTEQQNLKVENIVICDYGGRIGQIEVQAQDNEQGSKLFYLYVPSFAVNDTDVPLFFHTNTLKNQKTLQLSSGQANLNSFKLNEGSPMVLLGNPLYTQISLSEEGQVFSKEINMNQTGNDSIQLAGQGQDQTLFELGVNISLVCVDQQQQLFSKVMTVSPRFVFVNYTDFELKIVQDDCDSEPTTIESQQRVSFMWPRQDKPKLFRAQLIEQAQLKEVLWGYSQPLNPNTPGFTCFTLRSLRNRSSIKFVNCQLRVNDQIIYLLFQECLIPQRSLKVEVNLPQIQNETLCEIPYIIVNNLQDVSLICYQSCFLQKTSQQEEEYQFQEYKTIIPQQTQMPFAWEYPTQKNEIVIEFRFEGELHMLFSREPLIISLENMDVEKEYTIFNKTNEQQFKFYIMTQWEGKSKKLKFYQEDEIMERMRQEDIIELQLGVSISGIGISVLDYDGPKRVELLYVTLKNVELMLLETTVLRTSQLKIKYINIDSNSSYQTMFPVIMTPTKYREIFEFDRPQLSLVIAQSTQAKTLTLIRSIRACLQPTTIRLTSEVLENLYSLLQKVRQQLKSNLNDQSFSSQNDLEFALDFQLKKASKLKSNKGSQVYLLNQVQQKYGQKQNNGLFAQIIQYERDQHDWQISELPLQAKITYIDRIEIYPLYFNITFYNSVHSTAQYGTLITILKTVGIVLGNIDEAPIKLNGIYLENCFDTSSGITQKLTTHYKDNFTKQMLKILGSIEIIGNPVGLFKHIAIGVYDLFDKPIEGFIKGPIEGGIGIGKGVGSLIKNTVSGTFNSAGKIAGAVAGGFSTISMDPFYQRRRETMQMTKPRQIFEGVTQGLLLLVQGLSRGITGVIILPIDGAREDGVSGALIGTLKGATGIISKPMSGLFDFGSKTFLGVKATAVYWDDKANEKRERDIRVMYAQEQFYKGYNVKDSSIMAYLQSNWKAKYADVSLYDAFQIGKSNVLILSFQYIMYIEYKRKKMIWILDSKMLQNVDLMGHGVNFILREVDKIMESKHTIVLCPEHQLRQEIFQKSRWLLQSVLAS